jgi:hypothetical protein
MCKVESMNGCEHPEKLKQKAEECTDEQVKECHGQVKEHPCVEERC